MDCVFCRLLADGGPAAWIARRAGAAALLPRPGGSLAPGHTVVVATEHAVGVQDASEQSLAATILLVRQVARAMETALGAAGVNVPNASGPASEPRDGGRADLAAYSLVVEDVG